MTRATPNPPIPVPTRLDQLHPAPWNPRTIRDYRFQNLCRSIEDDPEFLTLRPVLATLDGQIYAGNMRYRAAKHLGLTEIPAIFTDIPDDLAKQRALRDNRNWGEWDDNLLAELLSDLEAKGAAIDLLGFDQQQIDSLLAGAADGYNPVSEWEGMPEYHQENQFPRFKVIVNFTCEEDVAAFAALVGQKVTPTSHFIWYPAQEILPAGSVQSEL